MVAAEARTRRATATGLMAHRFAARPCRTLGGWGGHARELPRSSRCGRSVAPDRGGRRAVAARGTRTRLTPVVASWGAKSPARSPVSRAAVRPRARARTSGNAAHLPLRSSGRQRRRPRSRSRCSEYCTCPVRLDPPSCSRPAWSGGTWTAQDGAAPNCGDATTGRGARCRLVRPGSRSRSSFAVVASRVPRPGTPTVWAMKETQGAGHRNGRVREKAPATRAATTCRFRSGYSSSGVEAAEFRLDGGDPTLAGLEAVEVSRAVALVLGWPRWLFLFATTPLSAGPWAAVAALAALRQSDEALRRRPPYYNQDLGPVALHLAKIGRSGCAGRSGACAAYFRFSGHSASEHTR